MAIFGTLYYVIVLLLNAVAVLNEERFLNRVGCSSEADNQGFGVSPGEESISNKLFGLIRAIRMVMRPILLAMNMSIIVYEIVLG